MNQTAITACPQVADEFTQWTGGQETRSELKMVDDDKDNPASPTDHFQPSTAA